MGWIADNRLRLLDILGTLVGLVYILLEYRASIYLWLVSIVMPLIDMVLYLEAGLYADFGMAVYYALAAIYGYAVWKFMGRKGADGEMPVSYMPKSRMVPAMGAFAVAWMAIYLILRYCTDSNVPVSDSFVNALSIIGLWALARKYVEQWLVWIVVDAFCCVLYAYKDIPFKAGLYGLYAVIAVFGYRKWKQMVKSDEGRMNA
ncbi:MAG: nicotinamide riboside transporter PnuC [Prevotella sp.]